MARFYRFGTALLLGASLAACSSFLGTNRAGMERASSQAAADAWDVIAAEKLEEGRIRIQAGSFANALEPLRIAARHPATAAAAHNAMGVAYAKLGRRDVAARLFTMAMAEDSVSVAYAANLARLGQVPAETAVQQDMPAVANSAFGEQGTKAPSIASASTITVGGPVNVQNSRRLQTAFGSVVVASGHSNRMERISGHEVRVGGAGAKGNMAGPRQAVAIGYPVKLSIKTPPENDKPAGAQSSSYPLRIRF